jgi:protein-S-isoprenylcysteine O-methyltransferase Ste14
MIAEYSRLYELVVILISGFCVIAVLVSVLINFLQARAVSVQVKREKRSVVATGTMLLFAAAVYFIIILRIGMISTVSPAIRLLCASTGLTLVIAGAIVNIKGRLALGRNWADQIKIYETQTLITTGVYRWIRHPLYASLIWMFYGFSLIYRNYVAFLATSLVFVPFMYYRAGQEEKLLEEQFEQYRPYRQRVGMLFPKLWRG